MQSSTASKPAEKAKQPLAATKGPQRQGITTIINQLKGVFGP